MNYSTEERAAREAVAGRLWRAKEILSGSIGAHGYAPARFAAYGRILARMQDDKEAGKFLFLSGLATAEEAPLVETFLASVRGRPYRWIYTQFPGRVRRVSLLEFPERVRGELRLLGFPAGFKWLSQPSNPIVVTPAEWPAVLGKIIVLSMLLVMIIGLVHGCSVISDWISAK